MNKSFIIQELYSVSHWDSETYIEYKKCMCNTLLWRGYSLSWKVKYLYNLILYKTLGV